MAYEYALPAGLVPAAPRAAVLDEGYELRWREDADPPHAFFWAQVSALRLQRLFAEAVARLPERVHAVLEVRVGDDAEGEEVGAVRWASPLVRRDAVLRVWARHAEALCHDGTVGFGAYDPDSSLEVFLDDHKLLSLFAPSEDAFAGLLERHRVPRVASLATLLDWEHTHRTLAEVRESSARARRLWTRKRGVDVRWFGPAIRRALRMRLQEPAPGGGASGGHAADGGAADA